MATDTALDPLKIYWLEEYIFDQVAGRFHADGSLGAADFFCIVIWKANRAKSLVARRLLKVFGGDLEEAVRAFTGELAAATGDRARFEFVTGKAEFRLPMASAVLAVLFPDAFTVYDTRVCNALGFPDNLATRSGERLWNGYRDFVRAVRAEAPPGLSLRDCDRWLWGQSFSRDLERDVARAFGVS